MVDKLSSPASTITSTHQSHQPNKQPTTNHHVFHLSPQRSYQREGPGRFPRNIQLCPRRRPGQGPQECGAQGRYYNPIVLYLNHPNTRQLPDSVHDTGSNSETGKVSHATGKSIVPQVSQTSISPYNCMVY
jgi:hypothetical protein